MFIAFPLRNLPARKDFILPQRPPLFITLAQRSLSLLRVKRFTELGKFESVLKALPLKPSTAQVARENTSICGYFWRRHTHVSPPIMTEYLVITFKLPAMGCDHQK